MKTTRKTNSPSYRGPIFPARILRLFEVYRRTSPQDLSLQHRCWIPEMNISVMHREVPHRGTRGTPREESEDYGLSIEQD